tara:strand:+ start:35 stop:304 length:270 start_codon:yes stop_codon:yes gene_type:complete
MNSSNPITSVKDWFTFVVAVITCVAGVIFWVQSSSNHKFDTVEKEISQLKEEITKIREDNSKILRVVGRLEGQLIRINGRDQTSSGKLK